MNATFKFGGEGIWTPDLLRAKQTLSQLSYTPRNAMKIQELKFKN